MVLDVFKNDMDKEGGWGNRVLGMVEVRRVYRVVISVKFFVVGICSFLEIIKLGFFVR